MRIFTELSRSMVSISLAVVLSSCGGTQIAGECADTANKPCVTGKVCTYDKSKGCEMCYCDAMDQQYQLNENKDPTETQPEPY